MSAGSAGEPDFLTALRARAAARPRRLVYPEGDDPRVLDAVATCVLEGLAEPVLISRSADHGPTASTDSVRTGSGIRGALDDRGVDPERVRIVSAEDPEQTARTLEHVRRRRARRSDSEEQLSAMAADPLMCAATMVALGEVDGMVAGCVRTTADVVRSALTCIGLAPGIETLSSAFYMVLPGRGDAAGQVLTFTDAGVVPDPASEQLAEFAVAAVHARARIVGDDPRVAFLSYSTSGSAEGASVERVRAALEAFRRRMPDVPSDGELQADAALDPGVAARKAPTSPVAGRANILVFPDLDAANIAYKLVQYLGGAVALGPVLQGLARPVNDLSRGAVADDIVAVSCITALQVG